MIQALIGLFALAVGAVVGWAIARNIRSKKTTTTLEQARTQSEKLKKEAELESRELVKDAKIAAREEKIKLLADVEEEGKQVKREARQADERFQKREEILDKKKDVITSKEIELSKRESDLDRQERSLGDRAKSIEEKMEEARQVVERKAGLSREEAKKELIQNITDNARRAAAIHVKEVEDEANEEAEKRAKRIVGIAIQRFAGEHVQERAVSVIHLPSDDLKGRIIGREGRNIRALEAATGIDLIVDDTPETVVISGFDPIRRAVARLSLERLIQDGRIHPTRIEEIVEKAKIDVDKSAKEAGEQAILELGLARVHPEMIKMLGRLKYRYSYAQNVLRHSVECGFIAGLMAAELGLNVRKARRAGLLHDLGKAMTHEVEGSHAITGAQFARKHGEEPLIVNAIASHHEEEEPKSVIAHLVAAADGLSGARPGARREMLETYIKRLENIENICQSFSGVDKSYAIQAGREVRVMVDHKSIKDDEATLLAQDIATRIENELTYPGQIKVTIIRETRASATAR